MVVLPDIRTNISSRQRRRNTNLVGIQLYRTKRDPIHSSSVRYLPVIPSSPTSLSTVYMLIQRSVTLAAELGQQDTVIVLDQAIYSKAQEILWKNKELFSNVVLQMGAFHVCLAFLAVIGKRFGDAGLSDVLIESGVVGQAASNAVMIISGKHCNRGVRIDKLVLEALCHILWNSYQQHDDLNELVTVHEVCKSFKCSGFHTENLDELLCLSEFIALKDNFTQYCSQLQSPVAKFWLTYISIVNVFLNFIRATRLGDWYLHLDCIRQMLPWFFAYDRINYSRYLSLYWCQMITLLVSHPEVYKKNWMENLAFSEVRSLLVGYQLIKPSNKWSIDIQKPRKERTIGFSRNPNAVQRWMINAHQRAAITSRCREMAGLESTETTNHQDCSPSRITKDKVSVEILT